MRRRIRIRNVLIALGMSAAAVMAIVRANETDPTKRTFTSAAERVRPLTDKFPDLFEGRVALTVGLDRADDVRRLATQILCSAPSSTDAGDAEESACVASWAEAWDRTVCRVSDAVPIRRMEAFSATREQRVALRRRCESFAWCSFTRIRSDAAVDIRERFDANGWEWCSNLTDAGG